MSVIFNNSLESIRILCARRKETDFEYCRCNITKEPSFCYKAQRSLSFCYAAYHIIVVDAMLSLFDAILQRAEAPGDGKSERTASVP